MEAQIATTHPLPPKARGFPIIGSLIHLARKKLDFIQAAQQEHGDIFRINIGVMDIVVLGHPDHAQHVFRTQKNKYDKGGRIYDSFRTVAGNGLATALTDDFWLRQRRMMQPHFHRKELAVMTDTMVSTINTILDELDALAESGEPFDIVPYLSRISVNIITHTLFGSSVSAEEAAVIGDDIAFVFDYFPQGMLTAKIPNWIPVPRRKMFRERMTRINDHIYQMIDECRRNEMAEGNLLNMLVHMVDTETNEQMTDSQLRDEVMTLFLAGFETTASTMQWTIHHLNTLPDIAAKVHDEVDNAIGNRPPTFEDLANLAYTRQVFQETLRLSAPGFWIGRTVLEDDVIDGYAVPAGKLAAVMPLLIHQHPDFWDDPQTFDPDRFLPEAVAKRHPLAWIPFGSGQRQCIGRDFGLMEGQLILALIMQRFNVKAWDKHTVEPRISTTLRTNGVIVTLSKH